jgi:hypothetical protein
MPFFHIRSLLEQRERKYGKRLAQARRELAEFLDAYEARVGKEVAGVVRAYAKVPQHRPVEDETPEDPSVFDQVRRLVTRATRLRRRLYSPSCCYKERSKPPYVLWSYGISWEDIRRLLEDGKLPLRHVLWLLGVLLNGEMRPPTAEEVRMSGPLAWAETRTVEEWHEMLKRRRRRLVRFLRTAARLEEDVAWGGF